MTMEFAANTNADFRQLLAGRDEEIIEPELPIIDAHHHLYVRPGISYLLDDYLEDCRSGHRIVASVYSETRAFIRSDGPEHLRPLGEIEFANRIGEDADRGPPGEPRVCAAIVGFGDFRLGDAFADYLDRALEIAPTRLRGVRQVANDDPSPAPYRFMPVPPPRGLLAHPEFRKAYRHLAARNLAFEAAVFHHQLPDICALADSFPATPIILNHMGQAMAMEMDEAGAARVFGEWKANIAELARRPNVLCKVGGLGLPFWGFRFEERRDPIGYRELAAAWAPYVLTSIETFGVSRCMMESDYPPDGRSAGFVPLWNALKTIVAGASAAEKAALFHGVAAQTFGLDPGPLLA